MKVQFIKECRLRKTFYFKDAIAELPDEQAKVLIDLKFCTTEIKDEKPKSVKQEEPIILKQKGK